MREIKVELISGYFRTVCFIGVLFLISLMMKPMLTFVIDIFGKNQRKAFMTECVIATPQTELYYEQIKTCDEKYKLEELMR